MAEALAAEFGVQLANQLGFQSLLLEVDCLPLVEKLRHPDSIHTELGVISRRIINLLQETSSGRVDIMHARREANNAAHIMAHSETRWDSREVWIDRPPIFLVDQLILDDATVAF
ncbi:unnamed protein product [Linum tenue]|uniref:RNase H type-1 domain-containing protein n=1 Tax=Linum tenue TaxID=586396 RepID=A0AAV0LSS3_9ROSI|nr:unnamed protein product [Linum tenue]